MTDRRAAKRKPNAQSQSFPGLLLQAHVLDSSLICSKSQLLNKLMLQITSRHVSVVPHYAAFGLLMHV